MQSAASLPLLSVQHVTKRFPLNRTRERYVLDLVRKLARLPRSRSAGGEFFWPVNDVSFDLNAGETVGIIGQNGTGKSTLLKIIGQILQPTSGTVDVRGRVATLLELGAGFHPDLTGRENVYLNSSILGLSRRAVNQCIDKIIEFADIGPFMDSPVKHYSSGMRVRLGFSIAIHVQPELLLVDEILAVGDENFQHKCMQAFYDFRRAGGALVLVSHSLEQVRDMCERVIWLDDGRIQADGPAYEVTARYLAHVHDVEQQQTRRAAAQRQNETPAQSTARSHDAAATAAAAAKRASDAADGRRWGDGAVEIAGVRLMSGENEQSTLFRTGDPLVVEVDFTVRGALREPPVVGFAFVRHDNVWCYGTNSEIDRIDTSAMCLPQFAEGRVRFMVDSLSLLPGTYGVDVAFQNRYGGDHDYWRGCAKFIVKSLIRDSGVARLDHRWSIEAGAPADRDARAGAAGE